MQFMIIDVRANGRGVIKNTIFWQKVSQNQLNIPNPRELPGTNKKFTYVFISYEAFQLKPSFMKPYYIYSGFSLTNEKIILNYRQSHRVIENAFGILTSMFKVLKKNIYFAPNNTRKIAMACYHLQNTATDTIEEGSWRRNTTLDGSLKNQRHFGS